MNLFELFASFLEGLALVVSPCILPVLPLVLGVSAEGGRKRPFGVIAGFVLAFTLFALFARKVVTSLGINPDVIKDASLALLVLFGMVMLSETLSQKLSALSGGLADFGSRFPGQGEGLLGGFYAGALIGLVWTPCAGPVLAAVLVQIIKQESDMSGLVLLLAFATGAGVPMLVIALMGRKIMGSIGFLARHAEQIRKIFGTLIILSAAVIASGIDTGSLLPKSQIIATAPATGLQDALPSPYPAPEIPGIKDWLNSPPLSIPTLKGKVVLVDFWTYSCINCVRTLPYITEWDRKYRDKGLVILGIHSPEFEFEKNPENVKAAVRQYGIHYPVALDNFLATWTSFDNRYWPAHYLIDRNGNVVYSHFGEGKYDVTENNIRYLLGLKNNVMGSASCPHSNPLPMGEGSGGCVAAGEGKSQTPETYLGYARAQNFEGTMAHDKPVDYQFPQSLPSDHWTLSGKWNIGAENITAEEKGAKLRLHFTAGKVFLVLGSRDNLPIPVEISLNGKPYETVTVDHHDLYKIISRDSEKSGLLEITCNGSGLEAYAFTFGE